MNITDPIADMLTRIRNGLTAKHETVEVPFSKMKKSIADILVEEGYINSVEVKEDGVFKTMTIALKYGAKKERAITGIKVLGGLGVAIMSTSKGVMTDKQARKENVGGEVLAYVW